MKKSRTLVLVIVVLMILGILAYESVLAQSSSEDSSVVNLSTSGSASQSRIVVGNEGLAQVFWLDTYDGLMTTVSSETGWTTARSARIAYVEFNEIPFFVVDTANVVHALWFDSGPGSILWHSRAILGSVNWSFPEVVAEGVLTFDVAIPDPGGLTVAYIRSVDDQTSPAGIYTRRWWNNGYWGMSQVVDAELYYRQWTANEAWVRCLTPVAGRVIIAWQDERRDQAFYKISDDFGATWSEKISIGNTTGKQNPRLVTIFGEEVLLLSQREGPEGCSIFQQELGVDGKLGGIEPIIKGLENCPTGERFFQLADGLIWVWGQGSEQLSMISWHAEAGQWSEVQQLNISYNEASMGETNHLLDLYVAIGGEQIYVSGNAPDLGDVWGGRFDINNLPLETASVPYESPQRISQEGRDASCMAATLDSEGALHIVWCEGETKEHPEGLYYARWEDGKLVRAIEVAQVVEGEILRQPSILVDDTGWLHLVWSGGENGEIMYKRSTIDQAGDSGGWSATEVISLAGLSAAPQLASGDSGDLFVVYAVRVNEERGVYLVHSRDRGTNWDEASLVYDASATDVGMVDTPVVALQDGVIHLAWVESTGPGLPARDIVYLLGEPHLDGWSWAKPVVVMGAGYEKPQFVTANGALHLICLSGQKEIWLRSMSLVDQSWGTSIPVPGSGNVRGGHFDVIGTGMAMEAGDSELHLVAVQANGLLHGVWKDGHWATTEHWAMEGGKPVEVSAVASRQGGKLAVVVLSDEGDDEQGIYLMQRDIEIMEVDTKVLALPTPTNTPTQVLISSETPMPSPTPDLNKLQLRGMNLPSPLIIGSGVALLVVVLGMLWGLRNKSNRMGGR